MTTKRDKDLIKSIEQLGYGYDRTNTKGHRFYVHEDTGCEIRFTLGTDERQERTVLNLARHQIGLPTKEGKRNAAQIRERNDAEHARAARLLEQARKDLDSIRTTADETRLRQAEEGFLRAERKFRYWDRLMRAAS